MSETELSSAIRAALARIGVPSERVQSGQVRVRRGFMHLAGKGTPDIVTPLGWLEVKLPGEKPAPDQLDWHSKWGGFGVRVAVVRSVSEAVAAVREWQRAATGDRA